MNLAGSRRFLGLAVRERSILAAEVAVGGGNDAPVVTRAAEFALPADLSLEKPQALGDALGRFLRQHRFSASRATVGVPARWLMARQRDLPPATVELAASNLRLQAERQFAADLKDLIYDYAGTPDPAKATKVLLVAMPRQRLEQITAMADAAGLRLSAVTSSTLNLMDGGAAGQASGELLLAVEADAMELAMAAEGSPRLLRHLSVQTLAGGEGDSITSQAATLGSEIRRTVLLMPGDDGSVPQSLVLWDGLGLDEASRAALLDRTGLRDARGGDLAALGVRSTAAGPGDAARFAVAAALALAGAGRRPLRIDFAHSRLLERKPQRISGRRALWAAGVAAAVVAGVAVSLWDARDQQRQLADLIERQERMAPEVESAKALAQRVVLARNWYESRPAMLDCLIRLTQAFPEQGEVWANNLSVRETGKGVLDGKATGQQAVLAVLDRLKSDKSFSDVKLLDMRDAGGNRREVSFTLSFTFCGSERPR